MTSSFTNIFGGTTVYPAEVSYRAIALSANTTLDWPTETAPTGNIVAQIMDVTPSGAGLVIRMPSATEVSVGETALFFNVGSDAFIVADNGGNTIASISPGLAWQVYLTSNTTVNGSWRSYQYGAGTSSATAGSLVGFGIKAIGATLNQSMPTTSISTNYSVGTADRASAVNWTGGAGTLTLLSASDAGNDWFVNLRNSGTGSITVQTGVGGQNINGSASIFLNPGDSAILFCDGSNFFTVGLGQSSVFSFDFISIDLTGESSPYELTGSELNRIAYRFVGTITGNVDVIVPATVQQYWVANETDLASGPYTITVKTSAGTGVALARNLRAILYCDGTNVIDADTAGVSFPISVAQGGTGATTESAARTNLGATSIGNALFTAASAAAARTTLGASTVGDALFVLSNPSAIRFIRINADNTVTARAAADFRSDIGAVGLTDTQTLTNKTTEKLILNDGYTEEVFAVVDGATVDLDPNNGSIQTWTLGANRTPGQANWAAGQSITLMVDDGSAFTITWSTLAVEWETNSGSAPTLATSGFTVIVLWKVGAQIYGARVGNA
jgi:hypothetical protein